MIDPVTGFRIGGGIPRFTKNGAQPRDLIEIGLSPVPIHIFSDQM
jgi:hypothetical protein